MIDSHVHLRWPRDIENLETLRAGLGAERMCIASVADRLDVNDNPALYAAKAAFPDSFYIFPALDHASHFSSGAVEAPPLVEQIDRMIAAGADGLKLIESKPTHRKMVDIPIDGGHYEAMFARVEEAGLPILWHVADPEEFWHPELTPGWASARGWGYDSTWPPKEGFYTEVSNVLKRHPRLKIIFAHFYFLSADLPRAAALFEAYEGVCLDLAPGIEMLYNLSRDIEAAREFFVKHSERIIFGTDIEANHTTDQARMRSGVVTRWLDSDEEYRVPEGADYTLGPPEDGAIRGMALPEDVRRRIYATNFERLAGREPRPLNVSLAIDEARRNAAEVAALGGDPTAALEAVARLRSIS